MLSDPQMPFYFDANVFISNYSRSLHFFSLYLSLSPLILFGMVWFAIIEYLLRMS